MKEISKSKEIEWLGEYYRFNTHLGSKTISIEKLVPNGFWGKSHQVYKTIYFGHINPLEEAVNFFNQAVSEERSDESSAITN